MKLTLDAAHNIAYLRLHEKSARVETIRVSDELNVDIAPDGTVCGIELLNANQQLTPEENGKLLVMVGFGEPPERASVLVREQPSKIRSCPEEAIGQPRSFRHPEPDTWRLCAPPTPAGDGARERAGDRQYGCLVL